MLLMAGLYQTLECMDSAAGSQCIHSRNPAELRWDLKEIRGFCRPISFPESYFVACRYSIK